MSKLKVLSLFSGIGAFEQALKNIGIDYDLVGFSEIDKYAIESYCAIHRVDKNFNLGDVGKVGVDSITDFDLMTFGFPCQDISVAGSQKGLSEGSGTRSSLLWEAMRIAENKKPKYMIAENVKNLVGKKFKEDFDKWLRQLDELGYNTYWKVLNAKDFRTPQNRERVFVVSIRKDVDDSSFKFPIGKDEGIRLKDILEETVEEKYYLSQEIQERFKFRDTPHHSLIGSTAPEFRTIGQRDLVYKEEGIMGALVATDYKQPKQILAPNKLNQVGLIGDKNSQANRVYSTEGIASTQVGTAGGMGGKTGLYIEPKAGAIRGRYNEDGKIEQQLELRKDDNTNTITTVQKDNIVVEKVLIKNATKKGYLEAVDGDGIDLNYPNSTTRRGRVQPQRSHTLTTSDNLGVLEDYQIRKLTPLECWRLMGFEDKDYYASRQQLEKEFYNGKDRSDSQMYKMAGNSIVVPVLEEIFKNLFNE